MMPSSILDKIEADTSFLPSGGDKIKALTQQLKEITPSRLSDKVFGEILRIANEAYHALRVPGKRTDDYIKSFVSIFEDVASWWFVFTMSLRKAIEKSVPLTTRTKDTSEIAKEVCLSIPIPEKFDIGETLGWVQTTEWLSEKLSSALNNTQGLFTVGSKPFRMKNVIWTPSFTDLRQHPERFLISFWSELPLTCTFVTLIVESDPINVKKFVNQVVDLNRRYPYANVSRRLKVLKFRRLNNVRNNWLYQN